MVMSPKKGFFLLQWMAQLNNREKSLQSKSIAIPLSKSFLKTIVVSLGLFTNVE